MNNIVKHTLVFASILSIMPIMANAQTDKDSVRYDLKLDTVHVTARRPIIKTEGSKDIVHVKGSYLGKLGNLGNMLVATPGISTVGQNMYEVVGKGAPKYYVDGREVTSQDIFNIGDYKVLVVHGHTFCVYRGVERLKQYALQNHIDIVMFGHTHKPYIEIDEDVTILNPGSVSYPRQPDHMPTFLSLSFLNLCNSVPIFHVTFFIFKCARVRFIKARHRTT